MPAQIINKKKSIIGSKEEKENLKKMYDMTFENEDQNKLKKI